MKIVDQTRVRGQHAVEFIAESTIDTRLVREIFTLFRRHPKTARAVLEQGSSDPFPALRIEELTD